MMRLPVPSSNYAQAVDFSILAISLVTLLTIQLRSWIIYASTATKALICLSIWIIPLCTSTVSHRIFPVSHTDLR